MTFPLNSSPRPLVRVLVPLFLSLFLGLAPGQTPAEPLSSIPTTKANTFPSLNGPAPTTQTLPAAAGPTSPSLPRAIMAPPPPLVSPKSADSLKSADSPTNISPQPEESSQVTSNGLVTNVFMDSDIRQVLSDIATQTGQIIVADGSVQGMVSCELQDVTLEKALRIVLSIGNYTWKQMDGFILVGSADADSPSFSSFSETRLVRMNHISASAAVAMLSPSMQKYAKTAGAGAVSSSRPSPNRLFTNTLNPGSSLNSESASNMTFSSGASASSNTDSSANMIFLTAPPLILDSIEAALKQMDLPPKQIILDTRVVVMENANVLELGAEWNWPTLYGGMFSDSTYHGANAQPGTSWPWGLQIGYTPSKEFTNSLMVTLNLLAQNYDVTVKANPTVVAQEGKEASVGVITDEYFEILTQGFYTNSDLQKIQSGTTLKITPRVGDDGKISLDMNVEVSDVIARGSSDLPAVTRRIAQSTVGVQDGGTAVVAGLQDNRTRNNHQDVPGLWRIPYLGRLFQNDSLSDSARQVAVFVTARLVPIGSPDDPEPVVRKSIKPVDRELFQAELRNYLNTVGMSDLETQDVPSQAMGRAVPQKEKK